MCAIRRLWNTLSWNSASAKEFRVCVWNVCVIWIGLTRSVPPQVWPTRKADGASSSSAWIRHLCLNIAITIAPEVQSLNRFNEVRPITDILKLDNSSGWYANRIPDVFLWKHPKNVITSESWRTQNLLPFPDYTLFADERTCDHLYQRFWAPNLSSANF